MLKNNLVVYFMLFKYVYYTKYTKMLEVKQGNFNIINQILKLAAPETMVQQALLKYSVSEQLYRAPEYSEIVYSYFHIIQE